MLSTSSGFAPVREIRRRANATDSVQVHPHSMEGGTVREINRARCPTVRTQMILVFHGEYDRQAAQCAFAMELRSKQFASTPFECAAPMVVGRATASSTLEVAMNQSDRTRCGLSRETDASKSRATSRIVTEGMTHAPNLLGRSKGSPPMRTLSIWFSVYNSSTQRLQRL